jgi:rhamnose transport system permease protein
LGEAFLFEIVTIVLLGGVSIYGGEGSIIGVVLSLFLIGLTRYGMILVNIRAPVINIVIGSMLIIAVLVPKLTHFVARES